MGIHIRSARPRPLLARIQGKNLRYLDSKLADRVEAQHGESIAGWVQIDLNKLDEETRNELLSIAPTLGKMKDPDDAMAQHEIINKADMNNAARQSAKITEKNAAIARLDQFQREQGLVPSDKNVREISNFIDTSFSLPENLRGRWTVQTVDLAVQYLGRDGRLEFHKPEPAQPATPPQPQVTLSDGSKQLPLDKPVPSNATKEQARDYLARVRKQQPFVRNGSFGSRF